MPFSKKKYTLFYFSLGLCSVNDERGVILNVPLVLPSSEALDSLYRRTPKGTIPASAKFNALFHCLCIKLQIATFNFNVC